MIFYPILSTASEMTYTASGGALNSTQSINPILSTMNFISVSFTICSDKSIENK